MPPESPAVTTRDQILFYDTDAAGVVHNLAYLRIIERCRTRLGEQLGFALQDMRESQRYPVVVRTEIDYRKPARLGDQVETRGWLDGCGRVRFWCGFEMVREEDQVVLVTCRQQLAVIQMPAGKPTRLPAGLGNNSPV